MGPVVLVSERVVSSANRNIASAGVVNSSTLAEDLASHGYVVVGFDAPYRTGFVAYLHLIVLDGTWRELGGELVLAPASPEEEKPPPIREVVRVPVDDEGREIQAS